MTEGPKITGATRLYAIIGDPIAQVRSPEVFTQRFAEQAVDAVMVPLHVPADRFDTIAPALLTLGNLDGILVTIPFKARMAAHAARIGATGTTIGAVNALRREADGSWTGDMFDGVGFARAAERKGQRIRNRRVMLFGAGGAGSAIACELARAGVESIDIIDTDTPKAARLAEILRQAFPACTFVSGLVHDEIDMIVNASPVGMLPDDGIPGAIGRLDSGILVGDVVIAHTPTALIRLATQCGCAWVDGRDMHAGQVDALLAFFGAHSENASSLDAAH